MTLKDLLEFKLLVLGQFELTVYKVALVLILLLGANIFLRFFRRIILRRLAQVAATDAGRRYAIIQLATYLTYFITILTAFNVVGFQPSYLLAGSAALFVGIGLGLQSTFNDFMGGLILLFEGSLEVEDVVEVNGLVGRVKEIGLRTTKILTRDRITVIIPNSKFTSENVINWTHNREPTRFLIAFCISYDSDPQTVLQLLCQAASDHPKVIMDPQPAARLSGFGDSNIEYQLLFWTNDSFTVEFTKGDIRVKALELLRANNIRIDYPQRDVHFFPKGTDDPRNTTGS